MLGFSPLSTLPFSTLPEAGIAGANFVGSASITFSQTGAFSASAAIAGATSITFSQTGALLASTALSGASTLTFSQSGALGAGASFAGAATVSFSATGTFVAGTVDAHFEGAATITFSATGDLTAGAAPVTEGPVGGSWYPKPIKYVGGSKPKPEPEEAPLTVSEQELDDWLNALRAPILREQQIAAAIEALKAQIMGEVVQAELQGLIQEAAQAFAADEQENEELLLLA